MNYDDIGKQPLPNEERSFYKTPMDVSDAAKEEAIHAKSFLSIVSPTSNISTYDHLKNILSEILRSKVENSVEVIEDISRALKARKFERPDRLLSVPEVDETVMGYINETTEFLNLIANSRKDVNAEVRDPDADQSEIIEEADVNDSLQDVVGSAPPSWQPTFLHDVNHHMFRFRQNGVGLGMNETYQINLAIKVLALTYKLDNVRFWGKIFGTHQNYYVAEVPYKEGIPTEVDFSQHDDSVIEDTIVDEETEIKTENEEKTEDEETGPETDSLEEDKSEEERKTSSGLPKIPPLPKPQLPPSGPVLKEKNGKGVNEYLYFVTNCPGQPWKQLPQLQPHHIKDARRLKRLLTGNIKAEVRGCTNFQGVEAHFLRAQIARISSSTILAPSGRFRNKVNDMELEGEDDDKGDKINQEETIVEPSSDIEEDSDYKPQPISEMMTKDLDCWVHARQAISPDGCCSWKFVEEEKTADEEVENPEKPPPDEEDESEMPEKVDENPIPRLRSIAQDKGAGKMIPWTRKISSIFLSECAVILARSSLWPGAFSYYDGTGFENVYIGYGYKASARHYAPFLVEKWQEEYAAGSDILEPEDEFLSLPDDESEEIETTGENSDEAPVET